MKPDFERVCAWCSCLIVGENSRGRALTADERINQSNVSHGMCDTCLENFKKVNEVSLSSGHASR